jgi:hypothetical protein
LPISHKYEHSGIESFYQDRRKGFELGETADNELASLLRSMSQDKAIVLDGLPAGLIGTVRKSLLKAIPLEWPF